MRNNLKTLITGGIRSGKSRYALTLAEQSAVNKIFIATAEAIDDNMKLKIEKHRDDRRGQYKTIEEPLQLAQALEENDSASNTIIIDCLTIWAGNLFHYFPDDTDKRAQHLNHFCTALQKSKSHIIIVTNEVGSGIIPDNQLSRSFADELGRLNQRTGAVCDNLIMMLSGFPLPIKGQINA